MIGAKLKEGWNNAFYKATSIYLMVLVTAIFSLQIYRFFYSAPASRITCMTPTHSALELIPVVGVFLR